MKETVNLLAIFGAKYLFLLIAGIAILYFLKQPRARQKELATLAVISLPVLYALLKLAAVFYYDPRPFVVGHFIPLIPHAPDNGFPSDHAILSAAAASLLFPYNKKISLALWLLTALVAISRVYAGIHHPIDVVASMVLAATVTFLACDFIVPRITKWEKYKQLFNAAND